MDLEILTGGGAPTASAGERTSATTPGPRTILFVDNTSTFGGAINSLAELVGGLDPARYDAVVVTAQPPMILDERFPGIRTRRVEPKLPWVHDSMRRRLRRVPGLGSGPGRRVVDKAHAAYWRLRHTRPQARTYAQLASSMGASLIHVNNNLESQPDAILAAKLAGLPSVVHSRSFQVPGRALRRLAASVDRHVAISEAVRDNLVDVGAPPERIRIIHDGIDVESFGAATSMAAAERDRLGIEPGTPAIGIFGRIVAWKGIDVFLDAMKQVLHDWPNARGFVVGGQSDGADPYYRRIQESARSPELASRVTLTGYRADVRATMAAMDIVVHASVEPEPFGMVLIEGMSLGKPVVATMGGGPDDIVIAGETGELVPRRDSKALAAAIDGLLRDPDAARAMGERGRDRVAERFSRTLYAERVMAMYDELLDPDASTDALGIVEPESTS